MLKNNFLLIYYSFITSLANHQKFLEIVISNKACQCQLLYTQVHYIKNVQFHPTSLNNVNYSR